MKPVRLTSLTITQIAFLFALVFSIIWVACSSDRLKDGFSYDKQNRQVDYYNLLVDGFRAGHLYMLATPDPALLSNDPTIRAKAPTLLDANFYKGHFYLYYGVVPALAAFFPYLLLTGHHLADNTATAFFVITGFLFSVWTYRSICRESGRDRNSVFPFLALLVLAFTPGALFLCRRSMFYEIPLACGYACAMGMLFALQRACSTDKGKYWILSSIFFGLCVGCHPNYLFIGPALLVLFRKCSRQKSSQSAFRHWQTILLPAAAIGIFLAGYNYARFGNPFETGFRYGQNEFFSSDAKLVRIKYIPINLSWYYFTPPTVSADFPFAFPENASFRPPFYPGAEAIHGQFPVTLLCGWTLIGGVFFARFLFRNPPWFLLTCGFAALVQIAFFSVLGIRANRYQIDGQAFMILAVVLVADQIWNSAQKRTFLLGIWKIVWSLFALCAASFNVLASLQQFDQFKAARPETFATLNHALSPSWKTLKRWGLVANSPGPLAMDVKFRSQSTGVLEPLVTTGTPGYSDCVYAVESPGNLVKIMVDHHGYGGPSSDFFTIVPGKTYTIVIDLGSFYPPRADPFYKDYPKVQVESIKTRALISVDDKVVLHHRVAFYDSPPWVRRIGLNDISLTTGSVRFSGEISHVHSLPPQALDAGDSALNPLGVFKCAIAFPTAPPSQAQPLMAGGITGKGVLFLTVYSKGKYQFGVDEWGLGGSFGAPVSISPGMHFLTIIVGSLTAEHVWTISPPKSDSSLKTRAIILLDEQIVADFSLHYGADVFDPITFGTNTQGFSSATGTFAGILREISLSEKEGAAEINRLKQ